MKIIDTVKTTSKLSPPRYNEIWVGTIKTGRMKGFHAAAFCNDKNWKVVSMSAVHTIELEDFQPDFKLVAELTHLTFESPEEKREFRNTSPDYPTNPIWESKDLD